MRLNVNLAGIAMQTPLVLLSGCVGYGEELTRIVGFDFNWVGAICLKGTTLHPKEGNRVPRIAETPSGMLNAIGLQNPGARAVVEKLLPRIADLPTRIIANIAGSTVEEYAEVAQIFDNSSVDGIEINISCPNVKHGGAVFGADPVLASEVVAAVRKVTKKTLITKLSPNVTDIATVARATLEAGTDAFAAINTMMGMAIDIHTRRPLLANVQGGLSGPAIKPIALLKVWQVYQVAKPYAIPIIGQGGIGSGADALAFFMAGASSVGVGTWLFKEPLSLGRMLEDIRAYGQQWQIDEIQQLTGSLATTP